MRHYDVTHVSVSVTGSRQQGDRTFHVMCNSSTNSNMIIGDRNVLITYTRLQQNQRKYRNLILKCIKSNIKCINKIFLR